MGDLAYIPTTIFSIPFSVAPEQKACGLPRMYSRSFDLLRAKLQDAAGTEFNIVGSLAKPDIAQAADAARLLAEATGLPCGLCSPELEFWQKEKLARNGMAFIQDERTMFLPFLGTAVVNAQGSRAPKTLSSQSQRVFVNLAAGTWMNLKAGELAERLQKSRASVSKYLAEIASISPALVETDGRERILRNPGFSVEEVLERFGRFLSSPVKRTFKIAPLDAAAASELGLLLAGTSALEAKTDLSFDQSSLTFAAAKEDLSRIAESFPQTLQELPWYADQAATIQEWSYPIDRPDPRFRESLGFEAVDDLNLYLSLKDARFDDVRELDALDQIWEAICR